MASVQVVTWVSPEFAERIERLIPVFRANPLVTAAAGAGGVVKSTVVRIALERGVAELEAEAKRNAAPVDPVTVPPVAAPAGGTTP